MTAAADRPSSAGNARLPEAIGRAEFIAMIATMMALNALALDIMLPAFPDMASAFDLDDHNRVQYVLGAYVLGFGGAQLVFGPLSDRFGRKAPLLVGLVVYLGCAVAAAFSPSFEFLLATRFIQGIGAAGTRVIALSVVRDTHSGREMASTMSMVMMVFMVVPVLAPALGQVILVVSGWAEIFLAMAAIGSVAGIWIVLRLPETLDEDKRRPLSVAKVAEAFRLVLTNRTSAFYVASTAIFFGSLFAFLNMAQPIYAELYGLGDWFPLPFGFVAIVMAGSSFANARLVGKLGQRRLAHSALIIHMLLSLVFVAASFAGDPPFWLFMVLMCLIFPCFGFIGANQNSIAMEPLGAVAGTASSVLGFAQTVIGGLVGGAIGQAYDGTVLTFAAGTAIISAATLVLIWIAERGRLFATGES